MPEERVVQARMIVNHMFTPAGTTTYNSTYTSILDGYPYKQARNIRVVTSSGNELTWSTFERDGFLFVEWWFDDPLVGGAVLSPTTVVEYHIYNGTTGCCNRAETGAYSPYSKAFYMCQESFSAGWANEWSSPVRRVQYTFALPSLQGLIGNPWYVAPPPPPPSNNDTSSLLNTTLTFDDAPSCCYFTSSNKIDDLSSSQTLSCQCTELNADENAETRSKQIVFKWQLVDPSWSIAHCRKECTPVRDWRDVILDVLFYIVFGFLGIFSILGVCVWCAQAISGLNEDFPPTGRRMQQSELDHHAKPAAAAAAAA